MNRRNLLKRIVGAMAGLVTAPFAAKAADAGFHSASFATRNGTTIGPVLWWDRHLTRDEMDALFNDGMGLEFPFTEKPSLRNGLMSARDFGAGNGSESERADSEYLN